MGATSCTTKKSPARLFFVPKIKTQGTAIPCVELICGAFYVSY